MQMETHLFLFGGGPPFTGKLARQFCEKALRQSCTILVMPRPGWENYQSVYADKLAEYGLKCAFIPLGQVPVNEAVEEINQAGALVIGGGNTERYIDEVVETPIGEALKKRFRAGVPVAGFSAGAILSMEESLLSPRDNTTGRLLERRGLGLVKHTAVAVHFSEWNDEQHLLDLASTYKNKECYGIDEQTGLYLKNGEIEFYDGRGVYTVLHNQIVKLGEKP
ncbi:hypothetical protein JCM19045_2206 [Bacillus sp. JCM 19045]|nr:hypothetical protein JCM19045_2206 [Bacillus sp. JCM 19045]